MTSGVPFSQHFLTIFLYTQEASVLVPKKTPACRKKSWPQGHPAYEVRVGLAREWVLELEDGE